ncbi:MAG TPA: bifunctional methylenetetrahydrofolate dehydrogenase/methenyltetrahydrofolate cyclohydrolase FolD [Anaerolineae bacterium]|nr:bifunctional methylenetetrahydrofolate dehydrogenase/methenyltetrahydrofolate cyclohydrolase FolD [Anaerolineae bacterium]
MVAKIIDGQAMAAQIREEVMEEVAELTSKYGMPPGLEVILIGEDPASAIYVRNKGRASEKVGIRSQTHHLPATVTTEEVLELIDRLNADQTVHGFLVQLPVPDQVDEKALQHRISPAKDVDGLHPFNVGLLSQGEDCLVPATPSGIIEMLKREDIPIKGQNVTIVGRSNIVGKPLYMLCIREHATPTICHTRTRDLAAETKRADILVAAVGVPQLIKADMVKPGAVVIDVGTSRVDDPTAEKGWRWSGDVAFDEVKEVASFITPVPGGVGPLTIAMLLKNCAKAARRILSGEVQA